MKQKNQMTKKKFRIGELARELQVKKFVIRFWEKEFGLKADRSQGGQRYYTHDDFKAFNTIKFLLYKKGFTIAGAKTELENILNKKITAATQTDFETTEKQRTKTPKQKTAPRIYFFIIVPSNYLSVYLLT